MIIKRLSRNRAAEELHSWLDTQSIPADLDTGYSTIRSELIGIYHSIENKASKERYLMDINFGSRLYTLFGETEWMNLRLASDDEFWAYLSIKVVPDIVLKRYGRYKDGMLEKNDALFDRFYKSSARLWLKSIWWFIHLGWQGNMEATSALLQKPIFNSDVMVSIVERPGKNGMYISLYREIIRIYGELDAQIVNDYREYLAKGDTDNLLRAVMRLHTARSIVFDPCLYEGGITGYAQSLFNEFINLIGKQKQYKRTLRNKRPRNAIYRH